MGNTDEFAFSILLRAQLIGALAATLLFRWLAPRLDTAAKSILVSH